MNFFEQQDRSRRTTRQLVVLFAIAVTVVVCCVYFPIRFVSYCYYSSQSQRAYHARASFNWFHPDTFCWTAGVTVIIIGIGTLVKIRALGQGGGYVAEQLGGRLISPDSNDRYERRLLNVVQEMAIASGVPVPVVYMMDNEEGINAFAAGYDPASAVVAVTRGCLTMLSRDELQGVIAHEFSHILSGDMRLNIRLIGLLGGILVIAVIGKNIAANDSLGDSDSIPLFLAALALTIIGYGGVFVGRILQCAVSRQREFLADASAVQFTRNPSGIADALKKIGGFSDGSRIGSPRAVQMCHMFFANAMSSLFSTHPPLEKRISLLDPEFAGRFKQVTQADAAADIADEAPVAQAARVSRVASLAGAAVASIGTLSPQQVEQGKQMIAGIPEKFRAALDHPLGASAAVCCLLLDADPEKRGAQIRELRTAASQLLAGEVMRLAPVAVGLDVNMRLPALDLAVPALRQLSAGQRENLMACVKVLIESDQKVSLFEFCLHTILSRRLASAEAPARKQAAKPGLQDFYSHAATLLSALAYAGQSDKSPAAKAFEAGAACMKGAPEALRMLPAAELKFPVLGLALGQCAEADPGLKQPLFEAFAHCALYDEEVSVAEAELLRAFAYCLDLPLPPFLPVA